MKKKFIFLILFAPAYYLVTVLLLQYYWFNYNASVAALFTKLLHGLAFLFSLPFLLPFIFTDLGEYWPLWAQALPFLLNGLLWGVLILLAAAGIKRLRTKKDKPQTSYPID